MNPDRQGQVDGSEGSTRHVAPTLTLIALAIRLARHRRESLG
jgi:hypothetical protein